MAQAIITHRRKEAYRISPPDLCLTFYGQDFLDIQGRTFYSLPMQNQGLIKKIFMKISSEKLDSKILIAAFLLISILAVYCQIKNFEFVYYDEPKYVRNNPMLKLEVTLDSIRWAFSSIGLLPTGIL